MKEDHARFYALQIVLGLECMHAQNIVHRDLKVSRSVQKSL